MQFPGTAKRVSAKDLLPLGLLPVGRTWGRAGFRGRGHGPHCPSPPGSTRAPLLRDKAQCSHPTGYELQLRLWGSPALQSPRVTVGRALSAEELPGAHLDSPLAGTPRQTGPGEGRGLDPQHRGPARGFPGSVIPQAGPPTPSQYLGQAWLLSPQRWGGIGTRTRREHPPVRTVRGPRRPRAAASSHLTSQEARAAGARSGTASPLPAAGGTAAAEPGGGRRRKGEGAA